jgi:hypothetical protein
MPAIYDKGHEIVPRKLAAKDFSKREVRYQKTFLFPQRNLIRRGMRGKDEQQLDVFSYISPEQRVPQDHIKRKTRAKPFIVIEVWEVDMI